MAMNWYGPSEGILRDEYVTETHRQNSSSPKMFSRRPYFGNPRSPTQSMSSSSSWSSSQESLTIYGSSPETPRLSGLKPQERLHRIRVHQELIKQQSRIMEVDVEANLNSSNQYSEPSTVPQQHSPMTIDEVVPESVRSVSLRLKRFRQARPESIPINNTVTNNCGYPSFQPWEREVPLSNKQNNLNEAWGYRAEGLLSNEYKIPQWILPILNLKPLRRPHFAQ